MGTVQAWTYYTNREKMKKGMDIETFDIVAWDNIEIALKEKSKMFKMWHAKQESCLYVVRYWTSKWRMDGDSRCPSYRRLNGSEDHLNQCQHESRTTALVDQIALIKQWMEGTYTYPDLHKLLMVYLRRRNKNKKRFQDLARLPENMSSIAEEQDRIGWDNFSEGRVTIRVRDMQTMYMYNRKRTHTEGH